MGSDFPGEFLVKRFSEEVSKNDGDELSWTNHRWVRLRSVMPLIETDFQAGVTTLLEAMAMAKPIVCTKNTGQTDVISGNGGQRGYL